MVNLKATALIALFVTAVIAMTVAAELYPEVSTAGTSLNTSGIGFGSLFAGTFIGIVFGAALLMGILKLLKIV